MRELPMFTHVLALFKESSWVRLNRNIIKRRVIYQDNTRYCDRKYLERVSPENGGNAFLDTSSGGMLLSEML